MLGLTLFLYLCNPNKNPKKKESERRMSKRQKPSTMDPGNFEEEKSRGGVEPRSVDDKSLESNRKLVRQKSVLLASPMEAMPRRKKTNNNSSWRVPSKRSDSIRLGRDVLVNPDGDSSADGQGAKMKFPSYEELQLLPEEIRETLMSLVVDFMHDMLYPRLVLLARRRQRRVAVFAALQSTPTIPVAFLQQVPFFSRWTNLEGVIAALELQIYEKDDFIVMQGDTAQSGVLFLAQGTVSVRRKKNPELFVPGQKTKGCSDAVTVQIRTMEPFQCYGEKNFLTEEPRMETLRALTRCAIWVLKKDSFFRLFDQLPEDRRRAVAEAAYERRREIMTKVFPLTAEVLSDQPLFSSTPLDNLELLALKAEPRVYQKNSCICGIGDTGREMYYIARGDVELQMIAVEGDAPLLSIVTPGTIVGEMGVFSTKKRNITLFCKTTADVYVMDHDMLTSCIPNQVHMTKILQKAHTLQAVFQQHTRKHHFEWISKIPFINELGNKKLHQAVLDKCEGKVYPLHSTVISVSETCDRLVLFTRGKARLSSNGTELRVGEALGFTCAIPHRWEYHVVAAETVETIEMSFSTYIKILKEFEIYDEVKELSLGLLYPRAHPEAFQRAISMSRHYHNPPCFPTSMEYNPKPFAARVSKHQITPLPVHRTRSEAGLIPLAASPLKLPPINNTYKAEAEAFIEALEREMGDAPPLAMDVSSMSEDDRMAMERRMLAEQKKKDRIEARKRLTAGKDKKFQRIRDAEEIERLSKRILELQRLQASSVPLSTLKSSHSSIGRSHGRPHSLPPISDRTAKQGDGSSPTGAGVGERGAPKSGQEKEKVKTRTIAIQTEKSFLMTKFAKRAAGGPTDSPPPQWERKSEESTLPLVHRPSICNIVPK